MRLQLGGWYRLGIVLSTLWILAVGLYVAGTVAGLMPTLLPVNLQVALFYWVPGAVGPDGWQALNSPQPNLNTIAAAIIGPIVALWLLGSAIGWIFRGFKKQSQS